MENALQQNKPHADWIKSQTNKIIKTFINEAGELDIAKVLLFIYAKFDDQTFVHNKNKALSNKIQNSINSGKSLEQITNQVYEDPTLSKILVGRIDNYEKISANPKEVYKAIHKIIRWDEGLKGLKDIISMSEELLSDYPETDNLFELTKTEYFDLSLTTAKLAVELGTAIFDVKGRKKIQSAEQLSNVTDDKFSVYSDIYFVTILRYIGVGLVHRVVKTKILKEYENHFQNVKDEVIRKIPIRSLKHDLYNYIELNYNKFAADFTEGARQINLVKISKAYLKNEKEYQPLEIYRIDPKYVQSYVANTEYVDIFEILLNKFLIEYYPNKKALIKLNIIPDKIRAEYSELLTNKLTSEALQILDSLRPTVFD